MASPTEEKRLPDANPGLFARFNLRTMSGVFPGVRTTVFQHLLLRRDPSAEVTLGQILWFDDPVHCEVSLPSTEETALQQDTEAAEVEVLRIDQPLTGSFSQRLQDELSPFGWQWMACGNCTSWQPVDGQSPDGLPLGICGWTSGDTSRERALPVLTLQSTLALPCAHWQVENALAKAKAPMPTQASTTLPRAAQDKTPQTGWWRRLTRSSATGTLELPTTTGWQERLVERSGVGAGTESCFACQGRIANLGALAVESDEGDKQTLSVWRCRLCLSYYFNNWIDRWERLDNLETEESFYRLSPAEAVAALAIIIGVTGGEHPAHRGQRNAERQQLLALIGERSPLSHQVKQGR